MTERILLQKFREYPLFERHLVHMINLYIYGCTDSRCDCRLLHTILGNVQISERKQIKISQSHNLYNLCLNSEKGKNFSLNSLIHVKIVEKTNSRGFDLSVNGRLGKIYNSLDIIPLPYYSAINIINKPEDVKIPSSITVEYNILYSNIRVTTPYIFNMAGEPWVFSFDMIFPKYSGKMTQERWEKCYEDLGTSVVSKRITREFQPSVWS